MSLSQGAVRQSIACGGERRVTVGGRGLNDAARDGNESQRYTRDAGGVRDALRSARTQHGEDLLALSKRSPVLIALLRHTGCPFCQEALRDIRQQRERIEACGVRIVVVFQAPEGEFAESFFEKAGLADVDRVGDPDRRLYEAMDVKRGNLWEIFGPHVLLRVIQSVAAGIRPGKKVGGDAMQLPGTVLVHQGEIVRRHVHRSQADRANYEAIACEAPAA